MINQLEVMQALRPQGDYCTEGEITESNIGESIKYVIGVAENGTAVFGDPGDAVTWEEFNARRDAMQNEYDSQEYARNRQAEYPSIDDLIVALWENVVEERASAVVSLEAKRQAVKTKYPKV